MFSFFLLLYSSLFSFDNPNVIIIIVNNQGYGYLSCNGNPTLKTPNIDKLFHQSIRFTDYHVSPTCSPTRGALISGHYSNRCGTWHTIKGRSMLFQGEITLGEVFQKNGYATAMFGKWHLGDNYPFRPEDRGFSEVVRHGGGGIGQTPDFWDNAYFDDTYFHNGSLKSYEGFCTDVYFNEAICFIRENIATKKPFFVYLSTNAPHSPFHCPEKYWKPYTKFSEGYGGDKLAIFYGMITNIDENIGKLGKCLIDLDIADNTIFIFTTDNGTASGDEVYNAGMTGKKGSNKEGGHRVPLFIYWKDGNLFGGREITKLTAHIDILPTLIELCGLEPIKNDYKLDGKSLVPLMKDLLVIWLSRTIITDSKRVEDPVMWRNCSIMNDQWRLLDGRELYDIRTDPAQKNDLSKDYPKILEKLRIDYENWWADISPNFRKYARIIVGNPAENPSFLTAHDWLSGRRTPWHQGHIRSSILSNGLWALKVETQGEYKISLRRWPRETGANSDAEIPTGKKVAGLSAYREKLGKAINIEKVGLMIGNYEKEINYTPNTQETTFTLNLLPGLYELHGYFILKGGKKWVVITYILKKFSYNLPK